MTNTLETTQSPHGLLAKRIWMRMGYQWRNSSSRLLMRIRIRWDTRIWARFPVVRSKTGGLCIAYAGVPEGVAYTLDFTEQRREAGSGVAAVRESSTVRGWKMRPSKLATDADIVIVGTTSAKAHKLPSDRAVVMPIRVHFVVDFDADVDTVLKRAARGERRNQRQRCRQHEWKLDIEHDASWFDHFYDRMYRPTMRARYGDRERIEHKEPAFECLFRPGFLFVLSMDGERIAGHLCHWNPSTRILTSRLLGVLDGSDSLYSAGAIKAMHFLLIEWSGHNGVRQLDFQGTEAFLSKSTYQFKRLFGTRVTLPPNHFGDKRLWFHVRRDTPAVRDFLVANPVLTETSEGRLEALYFFDDDRPARVDIRGDSPGVADVRHVHLNDFLGSV